MSTFILTANKIAEIGQRLFRQGLITGQEGNISVRLSDDSLAITSSGASKGFLTVGDVIMIDMNGNLLQGEKPPSSENLLHLSIYRRRLDVMSVVHAHPIYVTAFAVSGIPLAQPILPEIVQSIGEIPLCEFALPGTEDLARTVIPYLERHNAFMLKNHGAVTVGKSLEEACQRMEILERYARILYLARSLGKVDELSVEIVEKLKALNKSNPTQG